MSLGLTSFVVLALLGVLMAGAEVFAARSNKAWRSRDDVGAAWLRVYRWRWVLGVFFALASAFGSYPVMNGGERFRVMGFPFMVAAFDAAGRDYVSPLTTPAFIANAVAWFFLPHLGLYLWKFSARGGLASARGGKR